MNVKSLMAEWLEQASQWHEMYCHDLEVMSSNPGWVELGVLGSSALSCTRSKITIVVNAAMERCCIMSQLQFYCNMCYGCGFEEFCLLMLVIVITNTGLCVGFGYKACKHEDCARITTSANWSEHKPCIRWEMIGYFSVTRDFGMSGKKGNVAVSFIYLMYSWLAIISCCEHK